MKNTFLSWGILLAGIALFLNGCSSRPTNSRPVISVSIAPLGYIAEQITDSDFIYNTLVPTGASPETYEPSASQMRQVAQSQFYIHTGLIDFENHLQHTVTENAPDVRQINVSEGIALIQGSCSHTAAAESSHEAAHHAHGVDPHIWNSPSTLKAIATNIYTALALAYPDSARYKTNYLRLMSRFDSLDQHLDSLFAQGNRTFIIYHPALAYLARDYNLHQIAIENDGKEPSAEHIRRLVDSARHFQLSKLFYQKQFSRNSVDALAKELQITAVPIDPLAPNVIDNTLEMSQQIAQP